MRATVPSRSASLAASRVEHVPTSEATGRWLVPGHELVEVPAQALLDTGALGDEVLAVIDEQAEFTLDPVEAGHRQVRFAQGHAGGGKRIDGVALARLAAAAALPGHELGRHAHDGLARREQVALEAAREVAAVLQRPVALGEVFASPSAAAPGARRVWRTRSARRACGRVRRPPRGCGCACADRPRWSPCPCLLPAGGWPGPVGGHG